MRSRTQFRGHIDQQVRSALLDVDAASQLVQVARSNLELIDWIADYLAGYGIASTRSSAPLRRTSGIVG